ncbi:hypothetical protein ACH5RR_027905 [Cinchona calisaya]|uniref:Aminotransferase-like plant mobile domain-containing protein n=1 Tax=Cinchona calisaya TaxID=153742 RepID=A0ABD2YP84_9GENT
MAGPLENDIMEEREELMASGTGGTPQMRIAHFLKPTVPSIRASNLKLPYLSPKPRWPLHVEFNGWRDPQKKWQNWVEKMQAKHQSLWKKAGISEAIICSKYKFHRNDDLIFGIAERWCCDTNTFVFPWGEATITLEDMMILGGFSVLGSPVLLPLAEKELIQIEKTLKNMHGYLLGMKKQNHLHWLNFYMESGKRYEHEAFLSLWLSRFVFPGNEFDQIGEHVFPIAVHLARGTRIALAPAVLACIYRDLSLLKESIFASSKLEDESSDDSILALSLWAPLRLFQLWAWERFLMFKPEPNFLCFGDPRAARWHNLKKSDIGNVRPMIDSSGDIFLWRPYTLSVDQWAFPAFYREIEEWVHIGQCLDEALESFARFLKACVLVGIDCEEPYQPHRVALQFGFDQDIPALVPRSTESLEVAWINYSKPLDSDATLYIPGRLFESDWSIQYQQWWRGTVLVLVNSFQGILRGQRSSTIKHKDLMTSRQAEVEANDLDIPPRFSPKRNRTPNARIETSIKKQNKRNGNDIDVAPGFPPKNNSALKKTGENSSEKQIEERKDTVARPGFPPKTKDSTVMRVEISSNKQIKEEGNDLEVPPGFPPKTKCASKTRPEISSNKQIEDKGNDANVSPPLGFPPKTKDSHITRPEIASKKQMREEGNDLHVLPGFPPKNKHDSKMRPGTSSKKQIEAGKDADVSPPPGFPPKTKDSHMTWPEIASKKQMREGGNDLDVPPGFPPKNKHDSKMRSEPSSKKQIETGKDADVSPPPEFPPKTKDSHIISSKMHIREKSNDLDVPPGFPPKNKHAPKMRQETSNKPQIEVEGKFLDVPPGFPPENKQTPILRTETSNEQETKIKAIDLNVPLDSPSKSKQTPLLITETFVNQQTKEKPIDLNVLPDSPFEHNQSPVETSTKHQNKALDFDLNVPPEFFISALEQNQADHEMNPPSISKVQVECSSASAKGASGNVQPSNQQAERTNNKNENVGQNNCSFKFSTEILVNMQDSLKRFKSQVGGLQGSKI